MKIYPILVLMLMIVFDHAISQHAPFLPGHDITEDSGGPQSYLTVLSHDGSHSRNNAPQPLIRFSRCYFLILPAEMAASEFPPGVNINSLGFNYQYGTTLEVTGYFKVYFQNTSDINNVKSANWNQAISNMTLVHSDSLKIQSGSGIFDIPLNASDNFVYTDGGIYIAFEFSNPSNPLPAVSNVSWANRILPAPILRYSQADDSMRVLATASTNLRPEVRLGCAKTDIAEVGLVYAMGVVAAQPCVDSSIVKFSIMHNRDATDTIIVSTSIKNSIDGSVKYAFWDTIVSSTRGKTIFTKKFMPGIETGTDSIVVGAYAAGEEMTLNNKRTYLQTTSVNSRNHYIPSLPPSGSIGLNSGNGDCVAKFYTSCSLEICAVELSFFAEYGQGDNPYKVVIYAADGPGGKPGTLLHLSQEFISPSGTSGIVKRPVYFLNNSVNINPGFYYVGYSQTGGRNIRISYQVESPVRSGEFYFTTSLGSSNWIPFEESSPFRIDVAPRSYLTLNLKLYLQGFYDGIRMIEDTLKVILRRQNPPFNTVDSSYSVLDSSGNGKFKFANANSDSCYYFEVRHRNHIRTFSHNACEKLKGAYAAYDFTVSDSAAFGRNLIFIQQNGSGGGFAFYAGDSNQDGNTDATDLIDVFNNANNFLIGYLSTDITGDNAIDLNDITMTYNNSINFVHSITP